MRSTLRTVLASAALLALLAPGWASASGGRTLTVIFEDRRANEIDVGDPGPTPGDYVVFTDRLVDAKGTDLGDVYGRCTQHFDDALLCESVFKLPEGDIAVQTAFRPDEAILLAVTGGTRRYKSVSGEGRFTQFPDGRFGVVFRLRG